MNEFKGTPWKVDPISPYELVIMDCNGNDILLTPSDVEVLDEAKWAICRLVATAPDLLEALQHLIKEWDKVTDVFPLMANEEAYIKAKQIVKKALGE